MDSKCEKCFYFRLCTQPDYIIDDDTNHYCGIYENGIPKKYWKEQEKCEDYIEDK